MAGIPDCTLTTACYLFQKENTRTLEQTIESVQTLLRIPCYLVIYCNSVIEPALRNLREPFIGMTQFIVQEFDQLWSYSLLEQVKANREVYWPTRDHRTCAETHLLTCNKPDFVIQTIQSNPFHTTRFGWIDSNIGIHASKISHMYANHMLLNVLHNVTNKFHIQLLNVTDKKYKQVEHKREYWAEYRWVACGCLFTTSKAVGMTILNRMKELIVQTTALGYGHGEEMFYLELLDEFYDDIHRSYGDYKDMLHNFIKPTSNFVYIYWNLVMRYSQFGYWKECVEVCKILIDQYDNFAVEINYDLYVRLYCVYYQAMNAIDRIGAEPIGNQIRKHYHSNPHFRDQFNNLRGICGMDGFSFN